MAPRFLRRTLLLGGVALAGSRAARAQPPEAMRLLVVVAKNNSLRGLSLGELRQIYLGKQVYIGGQMSVPFNHPSHSADRAAFDRLVLHMGPDEVARYWIDQRIRGGSPPPRTADSVNLLLHFVARLPGAIGYLRAGFDSPELKPLAIDGKLPTDAGYPLIYG